MTSSKFVLAIAIALALLAAPPLLAQEARPTEASVRRVLAAAHLDTILGSYGTQVEASLRAGMQHELAGQTLNAEQRAIMDRMQEQDGRAHARGDGLEAHGAEDHRALPQHLHAGRDQRHAQVVHLAHRQGRGRQAAAGHAQMADYAQERVQDMVPKLMQLQKDTIAQLKAAASPPAPAAH